MGQTDTTATLRQRTTSARLVPSTARTQVGGKISMEKSKAIRGSFI
jgi:hypothetical protein